MHLLRFHGCGRKCGLSVIPDLPFGSGDPLTFRRTGGRRNPVLIGSVSVLAAAATLLLFLFARFLQAQIDLLFPTEPQKTCDLGNEQRNVPKDQTSTASFMRMAQFFLEQMTAKAIKSHFEHFLSLRLGLVWRKTGTTYLTKPRKDRKNACIFFENMV